MAKLLGLRVGGEGEVFLTIENTDSIVGTGKETWCTMSLEIRNPYVELNIGGEIITTGEIALLKEYLEKLINDKIEECEVLETLEHYLHFIINPTSMKIQIFFDSSKDYYTLYLDKDNAKKLYEYLINIEL